MNAVDLIVEDDAWSSLAGKTRLVEEAISAACKELPDRTPGVVAILLGGDEGVASMNAQFRGKAGATNVLSFPAGSMLTIILATLPWPTASSSARPRIGISRSPTISDT